MDDRTFRAAISAGLATLFALAMTAPVLAAPHGGGDRRPAHATASAHSKPKPAGDSDVANAAQQLQAAQVAAARKALRAADFQLQQAQEGMARAERRIDRTRMAFTAAATAAHRSREDVAHYARTVYMAYPANQVTMTVLLHSDPFDFAANTAALNIIGLNKGAALERLLGERDAAREKFTAAKALWKLARAQVTVAQKDRDAAAAHLADAMRAAGALTAGDWANAQGNITAAAQAVLGEAVEAGAMRQPAGRRAREWKGLSPAARLATAGGALLRQAARRDSGPAGSVALEHVRDKQRRLPESPGIGLSSTHAGLSAARPMAPDGRTVEPTMPATDRERLPRAEIALRAALSRIGTPYVWGASGPGTFDCSGLTMWSWAHAGVALSHRAAVQAGEGSAVAPDDALPGDLIVFGVDGHHVGMYLGAGYMVDAPHTGAYVRVDPLASFGLVSAIVRP